MKCPLKLKKCRLVYIYKYPGGWWFCFGLTQRKVKGVPRFDVIQHCYKSFSCKEVQCHLMRPEEAALTAVGMNRALFEWMDVFEPYNKWYTDNDET